MIDNPTVTGDPLEMSPESFRSFCEFITGELGIKMSDGKVPMLRSRLQRRLRVLGLGSLDRYRDFLFSPAGEDERIHFINAVTTNKTDFFREPKHFRILTQQTIPSLDPDRDSPMAARGPWQFRVWCAGCSSGEEPYTLAMVLSEHAQVRTRMDFGILATDISTRVLEHAALGIYDIARIAPIAPELRKKYLLRGKDPSREQVRIVPALRERITFERLNFMDDDYRVRGEFEAIFFRNVMIYFDRPTQEKVVTRLCRNLVPGGFLFIGHSESLAQLNVPVELVEGACYRKPA